MPTLYQAAQAFARRGRAIFPCRPAQKEPATPRGVKDAAIDRDTIDQWWTANPDYNIGVATGHINGFWALDVDGDEGETTLRRLEGEHGFLPSTVEAITGSGGRHLYWHIARPLVRNTAGRIGPGIDSRGEGGYVLAPPSLHPCGGRYEWSVDSAAELANAPDWLIKDLADPAKGKGKPLEHWHKTLLEPIPQGRRNTTLLSIAGKLLFHDVNVILARDLLLAVNIARCDPPLSADEVDSVIVSCAKTYLRNAR
jgi:hypothetical protein